MKHKKAAAACLAAFMSIQAATGVCAATLTVGAGQAMSGSTLPSPSDAAGTSGTSTAEYTPWTKVNGYYVDSDGNVMEGVIARGISVSKWQETIDWNLVAADDVSFAFIRMVSYGYEGEITPDEYFDTNMRGAAAAGLYAAPYVYLQTKTTDEARAAAQYAVDTLQSYQPRAGLLIAVDIESQYILELSVQELTDVINAFCQVIAENGYTPIVYSDYSKFTAEMDVSQIPYDLWYARYGTDGTFEGRTIWQSTESGSVNGISGNVCLEFAYKDYFGGQASSGTLTAGAASTTPVPAASPDAATPTEPAGIPSDTVVVGVAPS